MSQLERVRSFVVSGQWATLKTIARKVKAPEASVSARLRDLRKVGFVVQRRKKKTGRLAVEYRVLWPELALAA